MEYSKLTEIYGGIKTSYSDITITMTLDFANTSKDTGFNNYQMYINYGSKYDITNPEICDMPLDISSNGCQSDNKKSSLSVNDFVTKYNASISFAIIDICGNTVANDDIYQLTSADLDVLDKPTWSHNIPNIRITIFTGTAVTNGNVDPSKFTNTVKLFTYDTDSLYAGINIWNNGYQ